MKTGHIILIAVSVAALAACAAPYQPQLHRYWEKEGVSKQEAKDQLGYCRSDVGANHLEKTQAQKLVSYCMKSKGYEIMEEYR